MTDRTLRDTAMAAVEAYDRANPMRTADWHGDDCDCFRCEMDRLRALLDAHTAAQPAPDAVAEAPTDGQLVSACLSYNHGYGLMEPEQRDKLHFQCREWWRSIARAINDGDRP